MFSDFLDSLKASDNDTTLLTVVDTTNTIIRCGNFIIIYNRANDEVTGLKTFIPNAMELDLVAPFVNADNVLLLMDSITQCMKSMVAITNKNSDVIKESDLSPDMLAHIRGEDL